MQKTDRILLVFSSLGICCVIFLAGLIAGHYNLLKSRFLTEALEGGRAWYEVIKEMRADLVNKTSDDALFAEAKITWDKSRAYNGYTLICLRTSTNVYLLDMQGKIVHHWALPFSKAWPQPTHIRPETKAHIFIERAEVFPNGDLLALYTGTGDTPYGYGMIKVDKNSNILWKYSKNAHHNFYIDQQNGDIFGLTHYFIDHPAPGLEGLEFPTLADDIVRLSPQGEELESISILDAFRNSPFASMLYYRTNEEAGNEKWDLLHTNSITKLELGMADKFPMFKPGHLLISLPRMSALAVINPQTRQVVWAVKGIWKGQHASSFLPNGHILLFDNLGYATKDTHYSRILEIDPASTNVMWSYTGGPDKPFYSDIHGFVERLPNGNTLIADSEAGQLLEITPEGERVWTFTLPIQYGQSGLMTSILAAPRYTQDALPFLESE